MLQQLSVHTAGCLPQSYCEMFEITPWRLWKILSSLNGRILCEFVDAQIGTVIPVAAYRGHASVSLRETHAIFMKFASPNRLCGHLISACPVKLKQQRQILFFLWIIISAIYWVHLGHMQICQHFDNPHLGLCVHVSLFLQVAIELPHVKIILISTKIVPGMVPDWRSIWLV